MPLTTLDPQSALVIVDLQKGIAHLLPGATWDTVVSNSRALAAAFRARNLPVVYVTANGTSPGRTEAPPRIKTLPTDFADLVEGLSPQSDDIFIVKQSWGAFATTDLEAQLKHRGVTQVVITGVATGTGVEATARQAYEAGFHVALPLDAMADVRQHAQDYSFAHVFPRLGETTTTEKVLAFL